MSSSMVQCGICQYDFDAASYKDGKVVMDNPIVCPKCGATWTDQIDKDHYHIWRPAEKKVEKLPAQIAQKIISDGGNRAYRRKMARLNR